MQTTNKMLDFLAFITLISLFGVVLIIQRLTNSPIELDRIPAIEQTSIPLIIVITSTYERVTRLEHMTRTANTLKNVKHLCWIVVEDGHFVNLPVLQLLMRSDIRFDYLAFKTRNGYPKKGWYQRSMALKYLRRHVKTILGNHKSAVVYFADDDNSYDIRIFDNFIRNVRKVGMWPVGRLGGSSVEAPRVVNGKVVGFDVSRAPQRKFAVDMAGFAINLNVIMKASSDAVFPKTCQRGQGAPETCLLEDLNLERSDIEPFGVDETNERQILVWHTTSGLSYTNNSRNIQYNNNNNI